MFIFSAKMDKKKLMMLGACILVVIVALILMFSGGKGRDAANVPSGQKDMVKLLKNSKLASNEDRLALLTSLGWEVNIQPLEVVEVMVPSVFTAVYDDYNDMQKEQGLSLDNFKGKKVMRYTYAVVNYPSGEADVRATLLVYKNKLIGGDICSARLNGFMHTLLGVDSASLKIPDRSTAANVGGIVQEEYREVDYSDPNIYPID